MAVLHYSVQPCADAQGGHREWEGCSGLLQLDATVTGMVVTGLLVLS